MSSHYFPFVKSKIRFEGRGSKNPLAFHWYDENRKVGGKTMKEHLRFAVSYWHTFCGTGADIFGAPTKDYPWNRGRSPMDKARRKLDAAFEFFEKLTVPFYCFHDRDIAPEGGSLRSSEKNLKEMVRLAHRKQKTANVKLLWGTANLFSHPRYMNGAATNPDFAVVAHAGAQVKAALEATLELGGENYVFWGGREGYDSLLNTDMKRERRHLALFLRKARDYADDIGFKGQFLIEPKPKEPTKHQYDTDVAAVIAFLREFDLMGDFKLNIEANHATLAGHEFAHELQAAADAGLLGSIDANRGDPLLGWDTDYFPLDLYDTVKAMMVVLEAGGLGRGGLNFDAKTRRNSTGLEDLFVAHVAGMDAFARGLAAAWEILNKSLYKELRRERYASFDRGEGKKFEGGGLTLNDLRKLAGKSGVKPASGKQELFEALLNGYL